MNKHAQSKTKRGDLQRITQTKNRPATMEQKQLIITDMKTQSEGKTRSKVTRRHYAYHARTPRHFTANFKRNTRTIMNSDLFEINRH